MKHPKNYNTDSKTSERMANVNLKRGKAERVLSLRLWHSGLRYRLNYKKLPGSPDIAILKHNIAVFVDGEFWHGYDWEQRKPKLKRNRDYWIEKIEENMERDKRVDIQLKSMGWIPLHFWSKEVLTHTDNCVSLIEDVIKRNSSSSNT